MSDPWADPWFWFVAAAFLGVTVTAIGGLLSLLAVWISESISRYYRDRNCRLRMRRAAREIEAAAERLRRTYPRFDADDGR